MQWLHSGRSGAIHILHKAEFSIHTDNCTSTYKEVQLISKLQHTGTWSATAWLPCHLCYCLSILSLHLCLTVLSFSQEKENWHAFQTCTYFDFLTCLKLCKSDNVQLEIAYNGECLDPQATIMQELTNRAN